MSPFLIPLGIFAVIALIVAFVALAGIRDVEVEVHQTLYAKELEHQRKMRELDLQLARINQGGS